jgi:hypothetical protein
MNFFHKTKIIRFDSFEQWQVNILSNVVVGAAHSITHCHLRKQFLLLSLIINKLCFLLRAFTILELSSHYRISCGYEYRFKQVHTRLD